MPARRCSGFGSSSSSLQNGSVVPAVANRRPAGGTSGVQRSLRQPSSTGSRLGAGRLNLTLADGRNSLGLPLSLKYRALLRFCGPSRRAIRCLDCFAGRSVTGDHCLGHQCRGARRRTSVHRVDGGPARVPRPPRSRRWRDCRSGAGVVTRLRIRGSESEDPDDRVDKVPHGVAQQTLHRDCHDAAARTGQGAAGRSGLEISAVVSGEARRRRRRRDHHRTVADAQFGIAA